MKGILAVAFTVFQYGAGAILGFVLLCIMVYLILIVFGLGFAVWKSRRESKQRTTNIKRSLDKWNDSHPFDVPR